MRSSASRPTSTPSIAGVFPALESPTRSIHSTAGSHQPGRTSSHSRPPSRPEALASSAANG
ncbi:MAG: hypothetical protein MZV64_10150 [Ignavibacteriales bacterium]|nr:hypothetical protein [Ignavibacteriales bacterium]